MWSFVSKRNISCIPQFGSFSLPAIKNEPMYDYAPGSKEYKGITQTFDEINQQLKSKGPFQVPVVINGKKRFTKDTSHQPYPFDHQKNLCIYHKVDAEGIQEAIQTSLRVKPEWEAMPFNDRAAIFLKAADLLSTKYRYQMMVATMLGQGKTVWQAEIDAAAELCDFWRFNCLYASQLYSQQPPENAPLTWNRLEYRPLEGFVVAYSPFNFTAIGGNLVSAPALMGNVVLWKPSPMSMYANYLTLEILKEAGLPDGVIQFLPGDAELVTEQIVNHSEFAGLHFTGSTSVFKMLWQKISGMLPTYKSYPRIVGETGGKNMHFLHSSADAHHAALQTLRSAFEYSGQKCSACSRVYVPDNLWETFQSTLVQEHSKMNIGPVDDFSNHLSAVINQASFTKITGFLKDVQSGKNASTRILLGGKYNDSVGYYIQPTVLVTTDPHAPTMVNELFGPVVTIYVYPADKYEETLELAQSTSDYALTGSLFAQDRSAIIKGSYLLRNAAGNFYINDKSTGAVVGQQPFGGARGSGTNDKAGSPLNLYRWISPRTIKESFVPISGFGYPSNRPTDHAIKRAEF